MSALVDVKQKVEHEVSDLTLVVALRQYRVEAMRVVRNVKRDLAPVAHSCCTMTGALSRCEDDRDIRKESQPCHEPTRHEAAASCPRCRARDRRGANRVLLPATSQCDGESFRYFGRAKLLDAKERILRFVLLHLYILRCLVLGVAASPHGIAAVAHQHAEQKLLARACTPRGHCTSSWRPHGMVRRCAHRLPYRGLPGRDSRKSPGSFRQSGALGLVASRHLSNIYVRVADPTRPLVPPPERCHHSLIGGGSMSLRMFLG